MDRLATQGWPTLAAISYLQRRQSGTYEFRRRLPQALAGKPAPEHMNERFESLINPRTRFFKREFVRSLRTKDIEQAKTRDHEMALHFAELTQTAIIVFQQAAAHLDPSIERNPPPNFAPIASSEGYRDATRHVAAPLPIAMGDKPSQITGQQTDGDGPLLSEAFAIWKVVGRGLPGSKAPTTKTIGEAGLAVRYFTDLFGDLRLAKITKNKAREYREAVARVPSRLPKPLRKLPLRQLLDSDLAGLPPRNAKTINKYLQLLGGILSKAEAEGLLDGIEDFRNPFGKSIKLDLDQGDDRSREIFSKRDLTAIFRSPVYADNWRTEGGTGEAAFWLPLIALLSGMRLSEIAQLRLGDIHRDDQDKIWFFQVDRKGGRRTKTASSNRRIPLHPTLVKIGLLRYRDWLTGQGVTSDNSFWPGINPSAWSKWINPYLRTKCGISDSAKVFHSFRHTFKRMARDAKLNEEIHDALTGHSNKDSVGRDYGSGFSIRPLATAMAAIKPTIKLNQLYWAPPHTHYLKISSAKRTSLQSP